MILVALAGVAGAASLDNLEIGGPWGSPTTDDGYAAWWNPAGLAHGDGTRIDLEVAPAFATVEFERAGDHGGYDTYELVGAVPTLGVATDFGAKGLGVGAVFAVPYVRGGREPGVDPEHEDLGWAGPGSGSYSMRDGNSQTFWIALGGAYEIVDRYAIGATLAVAHTQWRALVDSDTLPDLNQALLDEGAAPTYTDADLENPDYKATLDFADLADTSVSFSVGARAQPIDQLAIGVAYIHGVSVSAEGPVTATFDCPPDTDTLGRYGVEKLGLCRATVPAEGTVAYELPRRVHGGIAVFPTPDLRLEAMGGWVQWSVYQDFTITTANADAPTAQAKDLVEQTRHWARDNHDSFWVGVDGKVTLVDRVTLGARATYDQAAVPDEALSPNNYDADALMVSGLAAVRIGKFELAASYTHHFLQTREVTTSGFGMTLEKPGADYESDRWYYPQMNGTYRGVINRIGLHVRAHF